VALREGGGGLRVRLVVRLEVLGAGRHLLVQMGLG